jgi:hypothetical protein
MAGVKTSVGKRVEPKFAAVNCDSCGATIEKLADAYHVRVIDLQVQRTRWEWKHRRCLNLSSK